MKRMHSGRIVIQALPAPGAPDYWDADKSKKGTKQRKLNSKVAFGRSHYNKKVDDFVPWQSKRMRNKQNRKVNALCLRIGNSEHVLGAPLRVVSQENDSHLLSSENIKSSSRVKSCIVELNPWKVKKRRSIMTRRCNAFEDSVITCELANAASLSGRNYLNKGRSSEMEVDTCYEGDLVMSNSDMRKNICDGAEETNRNNPSKSTHGDRKSEVSKDHLFLSLDSKSVSKVENRTETVPNVGSTLTSESSDVFKVNDAAIETRDLQRSPSLEVLITYSRKRRKNSSAPASSLLSNMADVENKIKAVSADQYQVSLSYCSHTLPEEVLTGGSTLLMGVQQMLLEKAANSSCSEIWNKEIIQIDHQKENINSSMASIKDECPVDSKTERKEQENRNETNSTVNVTSDIEFAKESLRDAGLCDLRASSVTDSMVTANGPSNGERQSATKDGPSQSRVGAFVDGNTQIRNVAILPKERQSATEDNPSQSRASTFFDGNAPITSVGIIRPLGRVLNARSSKKLLVLDLNGLLADIVPIHLVRCSMEPDIVACGKAVFKRPFHDDFLQFCFERFNVGVWSSRIKRNMRFLDFLMGNAKHKLLFCWDQSHCTDTGFPVVGRNRSKPIILKKLKKLWEKYEQDLPWERGEYDESNTLLLDDSPHKALCNPPYTAVFPNSYNYRNMSDNSLGPEGDLRVYLDGLSKAENVQKYVESNPFGQRPITEKDASWRYYRKVIEAATYYQDRKANKFSTYNCRY